MRLKADTEGVVVSRVGEQAESRTRSREQTGRSGVGRANGDASGTKGRRTAAAKEYHGGYQRTNLPASHAGQA
jgi:hypothetical protein